MRKLFGLAILIGLCGVFCASTSKAQWAFGARTGVYTDDSALFVGAEFLTPMGSGGWKFNPNLEWAFVNNGNLFTLNADFTYDLTSTKSLDFWAGGGPALVYRSRDRGDDEVDPGLNLVGGIGFLRDRSIRPYFLAKILISDSSQAVMGFGVRF